MADVRKNQRDLTSAEWSHLVDAINALHGVGAKPPAYRAFVNLHVEAMSMSHMSSWGVHHMHPGDPVSTGRNFLAWHRRYVRQLELRLQKEQAGVTIPYWDWINDRALPPALSDPSLLKGWSVTRHWNPALLPTPDDLNAALAATDFVKFQLILEHVHDLVHGAVGGNMNSAASPSDPMFFLHHANIDRLWDQWATKHTGQGPANPNESLQVAPIEGVKVSTQLSIAQLGYSYA